MKRTTAIKAIIEHFELTNEEEIKDLGNEKLLEVDGIGSVTIEKIRNSFKPKTKVRIRQNREIRGLKLDENREVTVSANFASYIVRQDYGFIIDRSVK